MTVRVNRATLPFVENLNFAVAQILLICFEKSPQHEKLSLVRMASILSNFRWTSSEKNFVVTDVRKENEYFNGTKEKFLTI